jgi:hypothetical protein
MCATDDGSRRRTAYANQVKAMCSYTCGALPDCVAWQTKGANECLFFTGAVGDCEWDVSGTDEFVGCSPAKTERPCTVINSNVASSAYNQKTDLFCVRLTAGVNQLGSQSFYQARAPAGDVAASPSDARVPDVAVEHRASHRRAQQFFAVHRRSGLQAGADNGWHARYCTGLTPHLLPCSFRRMHRAAPTVGTWRSA